MSQILLNHNIVQPTRKLAAILSADVFGYSKLMSDDEQATLDAIVDTRRIMGEHIVAGGGRVVDATGDALLAEFVSAVEAVRCAREIQRSLAVRNAERPAHRRMLMRIGLNLGDVIASEGALYGDGVNIAARLQTAAEPGGVCISASIREQIDGKLPLRFDPVAEHHFKNIERPVHAFHVRYAADGADGAPGARHAAARAPVLCANNLPSQLSSFIGRESDIAAVSRMLATHRLVTLLGSGGIGKSRLSLQVAATVAQDHPDGLWLVELASLADPRLVPQAVASVLGIKEEAGRPVLEALLNGLAERRLLVVLDNCEHLLLACAELARQMLQTAPHLKVLATSREPLRVAGEASYPVPALATPDPRQPLAIEAMQEQEAVRLFVDRAVSARPSFALTTRNMAAVAAICQHLDGIPLAIELAAARVRSLSVENIATRLGDRFRLLTRGDSGALPRQQTLHALIGWSHDLLHDPERVLFRRLAVFAGGWTLEAAEAVCAAGNVAADDVPDLLSGLVERSIVESDAEGLRYRLLDTVRQFAQERLDEAGEGAATRERHLAHYLALAESASAQLSGPDQGQWLERLDPERENFLAAHACCDRAANGAEAGLRLMFALKLYLFNRGLLAPLRWGLQDAIARPGAELRTIFRCRALHTAGQLEFLMGRFEQAQSRLEDALAIATEVGDADRQGLVLQFLGMTCVAQGDRAAAHRYLEQALSLAQSCGDRGALVGALNSLAQLHRMEGTLDAAEPLYEQGLTLARQLGDRDATAVALLNLAMVAIGRSSHDRAGALLIEALDLAEAMGSRPTGGNVLAVSAGLAALRGDWRQAAWFLGAAEAQMLQTGMHLDPADEAFLAPWAAQTRQALTPESLAITDGAARALSYEQAMAAARVWLHGGHSAQT